MTAAGEAAAAAGAAANAGANADAAAASAETAAGYTSADAATAAVSQAREVYNLARSIETEELNTRTASGIAKAKMLKARNDEVLAARAKAVQDAAAEDAAARQLAAEAAQSGADIRDVAAKGRQVAVIAMVTRGPFSQTAAQVALASDDNAVAQYVRTGWQQAADEDERARVRRLAADSETSAVRAAAEQALRADAAAIHTFLATGQHQAAANDYRVRVVQIMDGAGRGVREAGQKALDSGAVDQLMQFITAGQYTARANDDRVRAVQLMATGTSEVKASARIALEGPPQLLRSFIEVEQYRAVRQDQLAATHTTQIQRLIESAAATAATAHQNAALAAQAAAEARQAAAEAQTAAGQAAASAQQAQQFADQAKAYATTAEASAAKAAASAKTARNAETQAKAAASNANYSAAKAQSSAAAAQGSSAAAWSAAERARQSALAAGQDAAAADVAARDAFVASLNKIVQEAEQARLDAAYQADVATLGEFEKQLIDALNAAAKNGDGDWGWLKDVGHMTLDAAGLIPLFGEAFDALNCGWYEAEKDHVNAGLSCAAMVPILGWGATGTKWGKGTITAIEAFLKAIRAQGKPPHIWSANPRQGRNNVQNAAFHWNKHRAEFPELNNSLQYVELAHRYSSLGKPLKPVPGLKVYDQGAGGYAVYDRTNGVWAGFSPDGMPQTMYKPRPYDPVTNPNGFRGSIDDWLKEPGRGTEVT